MLVKLFFTTLDLPQPPFVFRLIWLSLTRSSRVAPEELEAAGLVLGPRPSGAHRLGWRRAGCCA
jgi:hypothetical protein